MLKSKHHLLPSLHNEATRTSNHPITNPAFTCPFMPFANAMRSVATPSVPPSKPEFARKLREFLQVLRSSPSVVEPSLSSLSLFPTNQQLGRFKSHEVTLTSFQTQLSSVFVTADYCPDQSLESTTSKGFTTSAPTRQEYKIEPST